jgi:transposase
LDLRERVVRAVEAGTPQAVVARTFGVGRATVERYVRRKRETGALAPAPIPGRPARIGPAERPALAAQVAAAPDATLGEHCATWERGRGARLSPSAMHRALARLSITRKKRSSSPASGTPPSAPPGGRR